MFLYEDKFCSSSYGPSAAGIDDVRLLGHAITTAGNLRELFLEGQ